MGRRLIAVLVIVGLLGAALVVDRGATTTVAVDRSAGRPVNAAMPAAAPADALSSAWFCAAGTATAGGVADLVVVIANPGRRALTADVTVVGSTGPSDSRRLPVPARGRVRLGVRSLVSAPYAAAQVEVSGGAVAVEREVSGPTGHDAGPCASHSSSDWFFAAGSTLRGADEVLVLFNPYPTDVAVDIDFATDSGPRRPRALQALPVPGGSLQAVRVSDVVTRRSLLAAHVRARSGRLVAERIQVFDGKGEPEVQPAPPSAPPNAPPLGLAVSAGVSSPRTGFVFPAGQNVAGATERIVVFNPSGHDAAIDVDVALDDPEHNGRLDPFPLSVPSGGVRAFDVTGQATIPANVDHSISVRSTNRVPVIAELVLTAGPPSPRRGVGIVAGSSLEATRWLFAVGGSAPPAGTERIVLRNLGSHAVTATIQALPGTASGPPPEPLEVIVPATGRSTVTLDGLWRADLPVVVGSSSPIIAERAIDLLGRPGTSLAMGVPLAEGVRPVDLR